MRSIALALLLVCTSSIARAADLTSIATRAMAARQRTMQADATTADVDAFIALMTDDVVYEDPVVNMRIQSKPQIRQGMAGFLGATRKAHITITKQIATANVVVLEQDVSFEEHDTRDPARWVARTRRQVTILEFDAAGKIRRLADYWSR